MDRDGDRNKVISIRKLKSLSSFQKFSLIFREKFYVLMKSTLKIIALTGNECVLDLNL